MATRAEQAKATGQRTGSAKKAAAKKARKPATNGASKRTGHSESKATYAREPRDAKGKATRKSTRGSANRAKADSSFNIKEEAQKTAPDARFRRDRAKGTKVRGS